MSPKDKVEGRNGMLVVGRAGMRVRVQILQTKFCFGRWDYLVKPMDGTGFEWVRSQRVEVDPEPQTSV